MMAKPLAKERLVADWYRTLHGSVQRYTLVARLADAEYARSFVQEGAAVSKILSEQQSAVTELISSDAEQAALNTVIEHRKRYLAARDAIFTAKGLGQDVEARQILDEKFTPSSTQYLEALQAFMQLQRREIDSRAEDVQVQYRVGVLQLEVIGGFTILAALILAVLITRSITRPLQKSLELTESVADGNLTYSSTTDHKDETGQLQRAIERMVLKLRSIVEDVRNGAQSMHMSAQEIARGNLDLSSRTEEQASALEQTAASMEQMTSTVSQNADNAHMANQLAVSASALAVRGGEMASGVVATMNDIHDSSRKVQDIIGVIDSIAFQTNILALNAAVEAARAGEQGRGFAVVASEVRSLAGRSAEAAKEIKALISDSVARIDAGHQQVEQAGAVISEVVTSVRRVTDIVGEISAASREQTQGLEQVRDAIAQMDSVTQQNAALVQEAAAATSAQERQALELLQAVSFFNLTEVGSQHSVAVAIKN